MGVADQNKICRPQDARRSTSAFAAPPKVTLSRRLLVDDEIIVSGATGHLIGATATVQKVAANTADYYVVAGPTC